MNQAGNRFALHLFYIRHNYWGTTRPRLRFNIRNSTRRTSATSGPTTSIPWFGPVGLNQPDTASLAVRPGKFDDFHIWAPSIIKRGLEYYMFYTGVKKESDNRENQRIGVKTSTDLMTVEQRRR